MNVEIQNGMRVPDVRLGFFDGAEIASVSSRELFRDRSSVVIGVPGAFTPVCSQQHIPDFIANAERFKQAGFSELICVAPNDPFVLSAWQAQVDPQNQLRFLSDGNLNFVHALGLGACYSEAFLGHRSKRYLLVIHDQTIRRARVERNAMTYSCTCADDVFIEDVA